TLLEPSQYAIYDLIKKCDFIAFYSFRYCNQARISCFNVSHISSFHCVRDYQIKYQLSSP
ncbi:hypothetical protein, partial [Yersinia rochesterensis]|uniref:hypothetical protein n=1 Tax=Yersinia rochesterensis TaxID=1604335 RepID=UPI001C98067A